MQRQGGGGHRLQAGQEHQEGQSWRQLPSPTLLGGTRQTVCHSWVWGNVLKTGLPDGSLGETRAVGQSDWRKRGGTPGLWDSVQPGDHKLVHLRKGPALKVGQNSFILMIYAMLTELLGSMRLCCVIFTRTNSFHPHNNLDRRQGF